MSLWRLRSTPPAGGSPLSICAPGHGRPLPMNPHAHSCGRDPIAPAYLGSMRQQSAGGRARHSPLLAFVAALRAAESVGRPLGPPAFLDLARGARRPRSAAGEARRQAAARGTGRGPDCEALMVISHVSSCESRDLHDGSAKWTYRASSAVWTANFLSFPFISFSESSFFKGLQQKLATPSPSPRVLPWARASPRSSREDAPSSIFAMTRKVT